MKVNLKKIESLKLSEFNFRIDIRECSFNFVFTDSIDKVEQNDNIVDIYVKTKINDQC
ncbi:unnamed protein product [Paramecium pentaurelia]|uniref:Uncharacterized protein n=1 Tax=Paramecium pentaurelia TaxID=43138 RepID=A0A8S1VQP9_9CILI|nr:unnamed protein product [Paramecium pentaurelia]